jgi:hypothetical protein
LEGLGDGSPGDDALREEGDDKIPEQSIYRGRSKRRRLRDEST